MVTGLLTCTLRLCTTAWEIFKCPNFCTDLCDEPGYSIYDSTKREMMKALQQYVPFVIFTVDPIATVDDVNEMLKALSG